MKRSIHTFRDPYRTALLRYLRNGTAASLRPAQRLGRKALALGVDSLETARVHDGALGSAVDILLRDAAADRDSLARRAGTFFVESMWNARKSRHLGMLGIRERVEMVGGTLTLESAPGRGTSLGVQVPFDNGRHKS